MTKQAVKAIIVRPDNQPEEVHIPNRYPYFNFMLEQDNGCNDDSEIILLEKGIAILKSWQESPLNLKNNAYAKEQIISGTFFVIGVDVNMDIISLTDEAIEKYTKFLS